MVISGVTGSEQVLAPSMSTVLELARRGVINQYPGLMPTLYPGALATVPTPFASVDAMWLSFQTMATSRTPDIKGKHNFSLPLSAGSSLPTHPGNRPVVPFGTRGFLSQPCCDECRSCRP